MLSDESSATRRFAVLGRPESLYEAIAMAEHWRIRLSQVQPFEAELAAAWLRNWNRNNTERRSVAWEALDTAEFSELIKTPVLLFMAAFTLSDPKAKADAAEVVDATTLYESFCKTMARGKLEQSGERHKVIEKSASLLAEALEKAGWRLGAAPDDKQELLPQAML